MGKEVESTAWAEFWRQEIERCFAREQGIWPDLLVVSVDEGYGELLVQRVWKFVSARLGSAVFVFVLF